MPEIRILADASVVELKPGADIAVEYTPAVRRVVLQKGEAHFQVKSDQQRPFVVAVNGIEVSALGTAFSVHLSTGQVDVLVTEGRVAVDRPASVPTNAAQPSRASSTKPLAIVNAGNRVVVDLAPRENAPVAAVVPVELTEVRERLAWRNAWIEFTGTRLADAIILLNRHNQVQFAIDDPALGEVEVSGYFRADNTEAFVNLLQGSLGLEARRSGDRIVLRKGAIAANALGIK